MIIDIKSILNVIKKFKGRGSESELNELLPCPFCGGNEPEVKDEDLQLYVECTHCGARGEYSYFGASSYNDAYEGVKKLWNKRAG